MRQSDIRKRERIANSELSRTLLNQFIRKYAMQFKLNNCDGINYAA
jgi:hypothetical protein